MGGNQSSQSEDDKKLEEYVRNQQRQVNQFYQANEIQTRGFEDLDFEYHSGFQIRVQQAPRHIPSVQVAKTIAVKAEIFLIKQTLKAVNQGNNHFGITFKYTSEHPAKITFYLCAKETINQQDITLEVHSGFTKTVSVNVAKDADFPPNEFQINLNLFRIQDLNYTNGDQGYYPLIIVMEKEQQSQEQKRQYYYCLFKPSNNGLEIKCLKTKLEASGVAYAIEDVYGIHDSVVSGQQGKECIVCLTEQINTMILPCKHMCLCDACCEDMRIRAQKCPMCRSPIESFMKMENAMGNNQPQQSTQIQQQQQSNQQVQSQNIEQLQQPIQGIQNQQNYDYPQQSTYQPSQQQNQQSSLQGQGVNQRIISTETPQLNNQGQQQQQSQPQQQQYFQGRGVQLG